MANPLWKKAGAVVTYPLVMLALGIVLGEGVRWVDRKSTESRRTARVKSVLVDEATANQRAVASRSTFDTILNPVAVEALRATRHETTDPALVRVFSTSARDKVETEIDVLTPRARRLLRQYYGMLSVLSRDNVRLVPVLSETLTRIGFDACSGFYTMTVADTNDYTLALGDSLLQELGVVTPETLR